MSIWSNQNIKITHCISHVSHYRSILHPLASAPYVTLLQRKSPSSIWIVLLTVRQGTLPSFQVLYTGLNTLFSMKMPYLIIIFTYKNCGLSC